MQKPIHATIPSAVAALCLGLVAASSSTAIGQTLYSNSFLNQAEIDSLNITRGTAYRYTATVGGRRGASLQSHQTASSGWTSVLGYPTLSQKTSHASVRYKVYFPSNDWQFRLQGKLPGLQPTSPHFGGNANDAPVWNKWSVRLMWISNTTAVSNGDDSKARPSVYIYDQNRKKGKTGTHYKANKPFAKDHWYSIDVDVTLNTYNGRTARSDGQVILKIDGKVVKTVNNLKLRGNIPSSMSIAAGLNASDISKVAFHNYYGGSKTGLNVPTGVSATNCYFDTFSVVNQP